MKQKILFVVSLLFGLMFINAGLNKFLNYLPKPKDIAPGLLKIMDGISQISWLLPLIAIVEIVGGILVIFKKTRALGAIIIFPVMVGILLTHGVDDPSGLLIPLLLFAVQVWIFYENRDKYLPMING
jgi:uncharacterized membrane protein YphA (DoxX/SURF4 family)